MAYGKMQESFSFFIIQTHLPNNILGTGQSSLENLSAVNKRFLGVSGYLFPANNEFFIYDILLKYRDVII